jgi:hypothetical protein
LIPTLDGRGSNTSWFVAEKRILQMNIRKVILWLVAACAALYLSSCHQNAEQMVAFTHINLVPMTSEKIIENQTVLVSGPKIVAIDDSDEVQVPLGAQVIDSDGAYLMPGLADMHMHSREDWEDSEIWPVNPLNLYLANGVTTIRDFAPYGSLTYALQRRDEIRAGTRVGPVIYASGKLLYASPLKDPEGIVRRNYDQGFDFLKLYSYLSKSDFHVAMTTAKGLDMYTAGHIPYAVGLDGVLTEGMDEIAHVEELLFEFFDFDKDKQLSPEDWIPNIVKSVLRQLDMSSSTLQADFEMENRVLLERISEQLRTAQIPVCTTMVVDDVIQLKLFHSDAFLARQENRFFKSEYLASFSRGEEKHQVQCRGVEEICAFKYVIDRWILKSLHDAGVLLLLGTDSGTGGMGIIPGYSIHDELQLLVENGFTPYEALVTGTVNAAIVVDRMTGEGEFGTIEVGKRADLILVKENPLEDVASLRTPLGVMAAGRWYPKDTLEQMIKIPVMETSEQ